MKETKLLSVFAFRKRRRAFALGEALILMIVVLIALGGIFSSIAYAMRLRTFSEVDLDSYLTAQVWFEALGSANPNAIHNQSSLESAAREATERLGGSVSGGRFYVRALELIPRFLETRNGVHLIELTVRGGGLRAVRFVRGYSTHLSNTVQDNAYKRRKTS